ncbi:angiogenin-4-like [Lycodopsis pacificus]
MRIPFACMLLLSATVLAEDNERYKKFRNQHINNEMSADRCDQVIKDRDIKTIDNECKETNTFILSTTKPVRAICGKAGKPFGQMTKSLQPFPIIVCELKNNVRPPRCQYSGKRYTRYLAIRCEDGFPVHYDRDIVHFEN